MPDPTETRVREAWCGLAPSPEIRDDLLARLDDAREAPPGRLRHLPWLVLPAAAALLLLLATGPANRPGAAGPDPVTAARAANLAAWQRIGDALRKKDAGKWAVIADGELAGLADDFETAAALAPESVHRYVYVVGEDVDDDPFVSAWYAPRFSGMALIGALGLEFTFGGGRVVIEKDGATNREVGAPPFPSTMFDVAAPGGRPQSLEVFVGTVGPPLMLAPPDWEQLGLARFEVPGTTFVLGKRCRRARVSAGVTDIEGAAMIVATCPEGPRAEIVEMNRWRDAFWNWAPSLSGPYVTDGRDGRWILFGANRILGEGATAAEALRAGEGATDFVYHRFLLRLPRGGPLAFPVPKDYPSPEIDLVPLNGHRVAALHLSPEGPWLVTERVGREIGLELAEEGREISVGGKPVRGGYAWFGEEESGERPLVFVVVWEP